MVQRVHVYIVKLIKYSAFKGVRLNCKLIINIAVFVLFAGLNQAYASSTAASSNYISQTVIFVAEASQTTERQQALERSLQEFDEKILRELEEAQQARQENARENAALRSDSEFEAEDDSEGQGQSKNEGEGQAVSADGNEDNVQGNETTERAGQHSTAQSSRHTAEETDSDQAEQSEAHGQEQTGSSNTQVADIPSGHDDDVIARQLREAAEAETDPEVKEQLWEEYRKYKNQ